METLAPIWTTCDLGEKSSVWEPRCDFPPAVMGSEPLSPHLQRNKQLQDTLLQRDEELIRLQDENKTLREFLGSSFVRNLQQRAKKLRPDGWRQLKRNPPDDGLFQTRSPSLHFPPPVSKRDRDTIDTSSESSSGFSTSFYDSSSSEYSLNSSFSFCPTSTPQTEFRLIHPIVRVYWSPSEDPVQFSPPSQRVPFSPIETSGSQTPRSQKDLAFRMSISPSSSVKTHSFPQGQAFVRRDTGGGRCNFTWVPTQGH
ncbi:Geminin coiled-coil domain containing protein 1 [Dissostichus eleginoides]|uniref:Geminin coiled-coil domain containing protein 1 n=1 Tax=Dissostichus eleginoides TaxID=100907 RepID=A0AAD9CGD9_DISEL|nr:Geminin coiled-coil domain containing protein 1 [Dissostichus eleginoides]